MRFLVVALLLATACGTPKKPDLTLKDRANTCDMFCAELAMGLAEAGLYEEARVPLERALEHAQKREREDVPWDEGLWRAHMLRLRVTRAVLGHHLGAIDEAAALKDVWAAAAKSLEIATFAALREAEVTFLRRADRRWIVAKLEEAATLDDVTRMLMKMVLEANSNMNVDQLALKALSAAAKSKDDHLLAAYIYCQTDACESEAAVRHVGAIVREQSKLADEAVDVGFMEADVLRSFLEAADESYKREILWIRDWKAATGADVPVAIPVKALGRREACEQFRGNLTELVRDAQASYESLVDASRCALSLGYRDWGLTLLARARLIRAQPVEALEAFVEFETMHLHDEHLAEYVAQLEGTPEHARAKALRDAVKAVSEARPNTDEVLAALEDSPAASYLRGVWAAAKYDDEATIRHLSDAWEEWTAYEIAGPLIGAYLRQKRFDEVLAVTKRGMAIRPEQWAGTHGAVAHAVGATVERDAAWAEIARQPASCVSITRGAAVRRAIEGGASARAWATEQIAKLSTRDRERCRFAAIVGVLYAGEERAEALSAWGAYEGWKKRSFGGLSFCPDAQLAGARERLAASPDDKREGRQNYLAWCLAERGAYAEGLAVFDGVPKERNARDTYGRLLIGVGRASEAVAIFEKLREERPASATYVAHLLIARLEAGHKAAASEIDEGVGRAIALDRYPDAFIFLSLGDALQKHGHREAAMRIWRHMTRTTGDATTWKKLAERCASCVAEYRDQWQAPPPGLD